MLSYKARDSLCMSSATASQEDNAALFVPESVTRGPFVTVSRMCPSLPAEGPAATEFPTSAPAGIRFCTAH